MKSCKRLVFIVSATLGACGAPSVASLNDGPATPDRVELFLRVSDRPLSAAEPNAFDFFVGSLQDLRPGSIFFCLGAREQCSLSSAVRTGGKPYLGSSRIFQSEQAFRLSGELILTVMAQKVDGALVQRTVKVIPTSSPLQGLQPPECHKGDAFTCAVEFGVVAMTNEYRASAGLPPLRHSKNFAFVSRKWSETQAERRSISHDGFPNARESAYAAEFGSLGRAGLRAENVAMFSGGGSMQADEVARKLTDQWWNSPGHQANMVGNFSVLGVGLAKTSDGSYYGTQIFGEE